MCAPHSRRKKSATRYKNVQLKIEFFFLTDHYNLPFKIINFTSMEKLIFIVSNLKEKKIVFNLDSYNCTNKLIFMLNSNCNLFQKKIKKISKKIKKQKNKKNKKK